MARAVCSKKTIKFKTKRGKVVSFPGRPGGSAGCGKKKRKVSPWAHAVGRVGKACARRGRPGTATNKACVRKGVQELSARYSRSRSGGRGAFISR